MFNLINKHPHRCHRLTSTGPSFITCDVMTDDGATLYVYVTVYAAIHWKGKSGRAPRLNPSALLIAVSSRVCNYATEIHRSEQLNRAMDGLFIFSSNLFFNNVFLCVLNEQCVFVCFKWRSKYKQAKIRRSMKIWISRKMFYLL